MAINHPTLFDWNQLSVEECVSYLKNKYLYSSTGDAKCIYELINAFEQLKKEKMNNKQNEVFDAIRSEREYQNQMVANTERPDMIEDLHIGDTIAAMQYNLDKAREEWYKGSTPHEGAMGYIRKVCGLGVQAGEKYGMSKRINVRNAETTHRCKVTGEIGFLSNCEKCKCNKN